MSNQVYISQDANEVNLVNTDRQIVITEISNSTSVNITQPVTSVITVASIGPQGQPGALQSSNSGSFTITGSLTISNILTLTPQTPLPSGVATGSFAVSSSAPPKPYFYDGTSWNALF
jgi:hypothetical protein